ncbi:hypothetical protein EYF80_033881 [Liparis tanakae]|uniref:Uncharacterized protein n=1 Tax=Liparis tanakae TaxID=230148 RepID=A0A4Z2GT25_9TELE|nr:hypothetical protein EYF80_033881 [Liparis tanakae]
MESGSAESDLEGRKFMSSWKREREAERQSGRKRKHQMRSRREFPAAASPSGRVKPLAQQTKESEERMDLSLRTEGSPPRDFKDGFEVVQEAAASTEDRSGSAVTVRRRVCMSPLAMLFTHNLCGRSVRPAHVSFPIDRDPTDTRGKERPHTAALLRAPGDGAASPCSGSPAANVFPAAVEEMGNCPCARLLGNTRAPSETLNNLWRGTASHALPGATSPKRRGQLQLRYEGAEEIETGLKSSVAKRRDERRHMPRREKEDVNRGRAKYRTPRLSYATDSIATEDRQREAELTDWLRRHKRPVDTATCCPAIHLLLLRTSQSDRNGYQLATACGLRDSMPPTASDGFTASPRASPLSLSTTFTHGQSIHESFKYVGAYPALKGLRCI